MKKTLKTLSVLTVTFGMLALSGCKKDKDNDNGNGGGSGSTDSKNTVTGTVKDGQGRPIAGATVRIENISQYKDVVTNAQGQYSYKSLGPLTNFKAIAWASIPYKDKIYKLRMGMPQESDYEFFDITNGVERNFQMKASGRIPDRSASTISGYFGFSLAINNTGDIFSGLYLKPGEIVDIILVPTGPLMDGSTGQQIERQVTVPTMNESMYLTDIPLGEYTMYAFVGRNGEWQRLKVGLTSFQLQESIVILPQPNSSNPGGYEVGVNTVNTHVGAW